MQILVCLQSRVDEYANNEETHPRTTKYSLNIWRNKSTGRLRACKLSSILRKYNYEHFVTMREKSFYAIGKLPIGNYQSFDGRMSHAELRCCVVNKTVRLFSNRG